MVSGTGERVEVFLEAASKAETKVFKNHELDLLPEGSIISADKGYADCDHEDLLEEAGGLHLQAQQRKKNSKRPMPV